MNTESHRYESQDYRDRELSKAELEAQIRHKERRLGADFEGARTQLRDRMGFHLRVTLPLSLTVLTGVGVLVSRVAVRRARAQLMNDPDLKLPIVAIARAIGRIKPGAFVSGGLLFAAGALLGARRRRDRPEVGSPARRFPSTPTGRVVGPMG